MGRGPLGSKRRVAEGGSTETEAEEEESSAEYEVEEVRDHLASSRGSRLALFASDLRLGRFRPRRRSRRRHLAGEVGPVEAFFHDLVIHPDNKYYGLWPKFILVWAVYSSFFTPLEFGFFRGLPRNLFFLDIAGQIAFLIDIVLKFFVAYRDPDTYRMVYNPTAIALRYCKSSFIFDLLGCFPWDFIYTACGSKEEVRYLLWIRLTRVTKITEFFWRLEKDIRINYLFTRIVKLIVVELYCTPRKHCTAPNHSIGISIHIRCFDTPILLRYLIGKVLENKDRKINKINPDTYSIHFDTSSILYGP